MTGEISRAIASTAYQTYEKRLLKEISSRPVPAHVAVIMDGNRRYAKEFGLLVAEGLHWPTTGLFGKRPRAAAIEPQLVLGADSFLRRFSK